MLGPLLANVVLVVLVREGGAAASCGPLVGYLQRDGRWEAVLAVTAPHTFVPGDDFNLQVTMAVHEKHEGLEASLELSESAAETEAKLRTGGRLLYRVRFPVPDSAPLPRVAAVTVNGAPVCWEERGHQASDILRVEVLANHKLSFKLSNAKDKTNIMTAEEASCGKKMTLTSGKCSDEGGLTVHKHPQEWPWLVAIFDKLPPEKIIGSGTLVTKRHVITGARPLFLHDPPYSRYTPDFLTVVLGATNTTNYEQQKDDGSVQIRKVRRIEIHPGYAGVQPAVSDHNVAVLELENEALITPAVRPACVRTATKTKLAGKHGYDVAWNGKSRTALFQKVPIVSLEECHKSHINHAVYSKNSSFCAGRRNGIGHHGMGAGFYVEETTPDGNSRWVLAGLANFRIATKKRDDNNEYASYIDVSQYSSWLRNAMYPPGECGESANTDQLLVHKGNVTERGDWPWLAALYLRSKRGLAFECGGTLIGTRHVVTAAHCVVVQKKKGPLSLLDVEKVTIFLGKHNLNDLLEPDNQLREVSAMIVHPGYTTARPDGKLDSDLAVLVLATPAEISATVRPACLWNNPEKLADVVGTVVGWGADELGNSVTEEPRLVRMPLVSNEECVHSHRDFHTLVTENTFCAGSRDGSGPCSGDSGSGLYLPVTSPGGRTTWLLRGVLSRSLKNETSGTCLLSEYVVFGDVARVAPWLHDVIGSS